MIHSVYKALLFLLMRLPMSGYWRSRLAIAAGVKFCRIDDDVHYELFIGQNVSLDFHHPELIEIGNWTTIATGCIILTHFLHPEIGEYPYFHQSLGKVKIGRGVFIGANSIICKPVTIGDGSVIAAGSVVLKDIPQMEIWGGNPARFLKKRDYKN